MDYHALQQKLFEIDPADPGEDIRKLTEMATGEASVGSENLTVNNLKSADRALEFYAKRNVLENSFFNSQKNNIFLNKDFFDQPNEIILRSIIKVIQTISRNYYPPRGKSLKNLIIEIKSKKSKKKFTLGGCILEKINETVIISKE